MWEERTRIRKDEICADCGTDFEWWLRQTKKNKVYLVSSDDAYCSKKCVYNNHGKYEDVVCLKQRLEECSACKGSGKVEV